MYKNAGKRLLEAVTDTTSIAIFGWVILGLATWGVVALFTEMSGILGFFVGAVIAITGGVKSWYKNLERAAFAEMAMNVYRIAEARGLTVEKDSAAIKKSAAAEGWKCAKCGQENTVNTCQSCGVTREWSDKQSQKHGIQHRSHYCPKCGSEYKEDARFCTTCGAQLSN